MSEWYSDTWLERSRAVLLDGCSTFSKRVDAYVENIYASHVLNGDGHYLNMSDGAHLLDTVSGLGSNLLSCENNYSMEPVEAVLVAEKLLRVMTYHAKVKFMMNGTDGCSAAVRYARAFTNKKSILYTGYHGCSNTFVSCTPPATGTVPEHCVKFETFDALIAYLEIYPGDVAGVIIEPLELSLGEQDKLRRIRELCTEQRAVLIYDEIITGWRVQNFTIGAWTCIYPDITVVGKAVGGGYPFAAVAVSKEIADATHGVFISHTFAANQESLRHALHTIDTVTADMIYDSWLLGDRFQKTANKIAPEIFQLRGYPTRFVWDCPDDVTKAKLWQELYRSGIFVGAAFFPKLSWSENVYNLITRKLERACENIKHGIVLFGGIPPRPAFKRV